jgi:DNA-directed RNA polymerase subunit RPC12/RpoP
MTKAEKLLKKFPGLHRNENCLTDIACPNCGHRSSFRIQVVTMMEHFDAGTGDHEDVEPTNKYIQCKKCDHEGTLAKFTFKDLDDLIANSQPPTA